MEKIIGLFLGIRIYTVDDIMIKDESINEYLWATLESEIKEKIKDLVDLLVNSKYGSLTCYYDILFKQIISEYKNNKQILQDKMNLCKEIMDNYYDGVIGIQNVFLEEKN